MKRLEWNDELFILRCRIAAGRKGWTLEDLCREIGANPYFLSKPAPIGRRTDYVIALARACEVTLDWLCGLDESPIMADPAELAKMAAVSNVSAHLYMLMRSQGYSMSSDAIVQIVLDLVERKALRPSRRSSNAKNGDISEAMVAEIPPEVVTAPVSAALDTQTSSASEGSRRRRTSQRRSSRQ